MDKKVFTLEEIGCWDMVSRPNDTKNLHTKIILKRNRDVTGERSVINRL